MMQPDTLRRARRVVECLRPFDAAAAPSAGGDVPALDARLFLSLALIAVHPAEVLGDDFDEASGAGAGEGRGEDGEASRGSRPLARSCRALFSALRELVVTGADADARDAASQLRRVSAASLRARTLFQVWKDEDRRWLIAHLRRQLEQSWTVYLTSSQTLEYLAAVTGPGPAAARPSGRRGLPHSDDGAANDPLMALRLRHEAGRTGSRTHIRRLRASLNKLIGTEEGKEVVVAAKRRARREIEDSRAMEDLTGEIDEICSLGDAGVVPASASKAGENIDKDRGTTGPEPQPVPVELPNELLSNRSLVHKVLLTDPSDFGELSWDGANARAPAATPAEFAAAFVSSTKSHHQNDGDMPMCIAQCMRVAFFEKIVCDMSQGSYDSIRGLLEELSEKMRSLLPSRTDLHSLIGNEDIASCCATDDVLRVLVRSGHLLARCLEAAVRKATTLELVECVEVFRLGPRDSKVKKAIPYGIESEELFAVVSVAFVLYKAELCQMDVSNYKLSQAAPMLHAVGHEYEREHFQKTHGIYLEKSVPTTVEDLQRRLPATWTWVQQVQERFADSENLTTHSSYEQNMHFLRGRGFVNGILFTRSRLVLPEVLSLDAENVERIRSEARVCVIASALALHACTISKLPQGGLGQPMLDSAINAKEFLLSVLRRKHVEQSKMESSAIEAIGGLTEGTLFVNTHLVCHF